MMSCFVFVESSGEARDTAWETITLYYHINFGGHLTSRDVRQCQILPKERLCARQNWWMHVRTAIRLLVLP